MAASAPKIPRPRTNPETQPFWDARGRRASC